MSAEFSAKLQSRYSGGAPQATPNRISNYLERQQKFAEVSFEIGAMVPENVMAMFLTKKGNLDEEKVAKFTRSAQRIIEIYGEEALGALTPQCIREKGGINEKKFRRNLKS